MFTTKNPSFLTFFFPHNQHPYHYHHKIFKRKKYIILLLLSVYSLFVHIRVRKKIIKPFNGISIGRGGRDRAFRSPPDGVLLG